MLPVLLLPPRTSREGLCMQVCAKVGLPAVEDFNEGNRTGCGTYQFNIRDGLRDSAAAAFLGRRGAMSRPNLSIRLGAMATKIVTDSTATATGVQYTECPECPEIVVNARHEVIVTAGAINTPKLLLLSGIGPAEDLEAIEGMEVVADIPGVGHNLHDAPMTQVRWEVTPPPPGIKAFNPCKTPDQQTQIECIERLEQYNHNRTGQFAQPGISAGGFLVSPVSQRLLGKPDIQITVLPSGQSWEKIEPNATEGVMTWTLTLNNALSHGRVTLNGTLDPYRAPSAWADYLDRPEDMEALLWAVKQVRKMAALEPLKSHIWREVTATALGC